MRTPNEDDLRRQTPCLHSLLKTITFDFDIDDLADTIAGNKAVVYTGAGTSMPAGLPGWRGFLRYCLRRSKGSPGHRKSSELHDEGWWEKADALLRQEDYLTSAGILQQVIGASLEAYVWDMFGTATEPTSIHRAIARIPFSIAITTNYDRLLESAYRSKPNVWTWRDPQALFSSIKHRRFAVVKIHGDVGNGPSLVLTKNQYRDLMHMNKSFNECLISLLSLRSFLFVGTSLKDHDLTHLMDMAKLTFGADFGPHYAICFEDEIDASVSRLLLESYNIHCIICKKPQGIEDESQWRTESVCSFLTYLSGKVSQRQTSSSPGISNLEEPVFNLRDASIDLSEHARISTAADHCRIAFVKEPRLPSLYIASSPRQRRRQEGVSSLPSLFTNESLHISPSSYLGKLFVRLRETEDFDYVGDSVEALERSRENAPSTDVVISGENRSVLTVPVFADGQRVGLISVEYKGVDAFTEDHLAGLQNCAKAAGAAYLEFRHRQKCVDSLLPYMKNPNAFELTMNMSRQLRDSKLNYLLYEIDYAAGRLIAKPAASIEVKEPHDKFSFDFNEQECLASSVFRSKREQWIPDAKAELMSEKSRLSEKGVEFFEIEGPVFATPIRVFGSVATVLVCWQKKNLEIQNEPKEENKLQFVKSEKPRISTLASLIANSPEESFGKTTQRRSHRYISNLNTALKTVDNGKNWTSAQMNSPVFFGNIIKVAMSSLVHPSCGLNRIRFWMRTQSSNGHRKFVLKKSLCGEKGMDWDRYVSKEAWTDDSDPFCRYTVERAFDGQSNKAQFQHTKMFGMEDPNWQMLDKDPNGIWIVCPITYKRKIYGFLSADNHVKGVEQPVSDKELELQRCAMDVAVRLIARLVWLHSNRVLKPRNKKSVRKKK